MFEGANAMTYSIALHIPKSGPTVEGDAIRKTKKKTFHYRTALALAIGKKRLARVWKCIIP